MSTRPLWPHRVHVSVAVLAGSVGICAAEPPAGIVMSVSGTTIPELLPRSEIAEHSPIRLEPGARLVLLHYRACLLITVTGGTIVLDPSDIDASNAVVESEKQVPCPRVQRLSLESGAPQGGAVVMRGVARQLRLPAELDLILTGPKAQEVISTDILDTRNVVRAHGDSSAVNGSLQTGEPYRLRLTLRGEAVPTEIPFTAVPITPEGPTILGLD